MQVRELPLPMQAASLNGVQAKEMQGTPPTSCREARVPLCPARGKGASLRGPHGGKDLKFHRFQFLQEENTFLPTQTRGLMIRGAILFETSGFCLPLFNSFGPWVGELRAIRGWGCELVVVMGYPATNLSVG